LGCIKAIAGLLLVLIVHIPRLLLSLLQLSYAAVFNNRPNLTADPVEHLRRAKRLLRKRRNSLLLYAAVEVRFALERIAHRQLYSSRISRRARQEYDPVKKVKALQRADSATRFRHRIFWVHRETGERFAWGEYKPLDLERVKLIQGRLGDLLHPKVGIPLGLADDPWYRATYEFLWDTIQYLEPIAKNNRDYFGYKDAPHHELERMTDGPAA
jgi:hypothetical protein